jgi:hypothetical protein
MGPDLTVDKLRTLVHNGELGLDDVIPRPNELLAAEAALQTALTPDTGVPLGNTVRLVGYSGATASPLDRGCVEIIPAGPDSRIQLRFDTADAIRILPSNTGTVSLFLATAADPAIYSSPRNSAVTVNTPVVLQIAIPGVEPAIALPAGRSLVCGLAR